MHINTNTIIVILSLCCMVYPFIVIVAKFALASLEIQHYLIKEVVHIVSARKDAVETLSQLLIARCTAIAKTSKKVDRLMHKTTLNMLIRAVKNTSPTLLITVSRKTTRDLENSPDILNVWQPFAKKIYRKNISRTKVAQKIH